jgi:hypothetical protein
MQDDLPESSEVVIRGLIRLPDQLTGKFDRPHKDRDDFLRLANYRNTGKPENGLSVFRQVKYPTSQTFYARLKMPKKAKGMATCVLATLEKIGITYIVGGPDNEHLSLRCPGCNKGDICKPEEGASFADCPFFDKADPLDLTGKFEEIEAPAMRHCHFS